MAKALAKLQTNQPLSRVYLSGDDDPPPLLLSQGQEPTASPQLGCRHRRFLNRSVSVIVRWCNQLDGLRRTDARNANFCWR